MKEYKSVFSDMITGYVDFKKKLGYKTDNLYYSLYLFDSYAVKSGIIEISFTKEQALEWQELRPNEKPSTRTARCSILIQFLGYVNTMGYSCYIPDYPPAAPNTYVPYIFNYEEIEKIFDACDKVNIIRNSRNGANVVPAMFRLMYGTGIRISEAIELKKQDVNLQDQLLIIRKSKNGKERMVPFSSSVAETCSNYLYASEQFRNGNDNFFIQRNGRPCNRHTMYLWFRRILDNAGLEHCGSGKGPRLHDLRHTFSVHALAKMADEGLDLYYSLPILSKYLGHESLDATDKYVRLTEAMYPGLIRQANNISSYVFPEVRADE